MCHTHAALRDHGQACVGRSGHSFFAVRVLLEPQHLRANGDGGPRYGQRLLRRTEHVHDIDRNVDVAQRLEGALAQDLAAARIHRDDAVALGLEVARDVVPGLADRARRADHGDRLRLRMRHEPTLMERALRDRTMDQLNDRYELRRKIAREPGLAAILEEFIGRLERAFGSLEGVRGKRILDIASGSNSSRSPDTGPRTALFAPWFARLGRALGGAPVALDAGDLDGEPFEHHRVDLGRSGALDFLPDASFDGV